LSDDPCAAILARMNKRVLGVIVGLVGIAALLLGLETFHWVVGSDFGIDTHVGLRVMELCQEVRPDTDQPAERVCGTISHDEIARSPSKRDGFETFSWFANITFYTGLVGIVILLVVMLFALAGRYPKSGIAPSTLAILGNIATMVLIVTTLAIHPWKDLGWGTGYSIFLAGGGGSACLFSAIVLGRLRPPARDDW